MQCPKCQFENREEAKFCKECGAKLELACPKCGAITTPDSKFCDACGYNLKKLKESPSIDYSTPQSYTPKFLVDKILTTRSSLEGERKLVTVLFADVANYTAISEQLDPEEIHQILDGCFKILMDAIHQYEGTINQFTGDGAMAIFGAPVAHEDHAQRACHAALNIQEAIKEYGEGVRKDCGVEFKLRIGLNSGPVIVGSIGNDLRMDYTAVGDTTNLAARMESTASPGTIQVSKDTQRLVKDFFEFESLGKVEMKGKREPQEAYQLLKAGEVKTRIGASVARGLTRFVGRKNSIAALKEALKEVEGGSGQVVGIVGEAGVGKSRLLHEFKNQLPKNKYAYIDGRCLPFGSSISYLPFLDILRCYFEIKEGDREFIIKKKMAEKLSELDEKLEYTLSPFRDLLSLKVENEDFIKLGPQQKRERTFEAIRDLFIRVSQEKLLILAVEDMHWIDKTSEELLNYLIGWLASTNILLILLYRPEYIHQWGSKSYYRKIGLNQLTAQSSAELVQAILERGEVNLKIRELILNRTSGNPLFMEELTHNLLESGSIKKKDHQFVLSCKVSDIQVPDTIQGIIAARMDRLEDNIKRTMQVASVIGRDFALRILQAITGLGEELKAYLLNLQELEFIYEKSIFPELEYIFKHALTQEVAYNSLLHKRRKEIHGQIGEAIEQIYPERLEELYEILAYHFDQGEVWGKAVEYKVKAGMKARHNYSIQTALDNFNRAREILEMHKADVPWGLRYNLSLERGAALLDLGQGHYAFQELKRAEDIALSEGATDLKVKAMFLQATAARISLDIGQVKVILEEIEPLVADNIESLLGVVGQQAFCSVALWEDLPMAIGKEKEMNDLIHRTPNSPFSDQVAFYSGFFHRWRGDCKKCSEILEPVLPALKASATPVLYVNSIFTYALALGEQGRYQKAIGIMEEGRKSGEKSGGLYATPVMSNSLGWAYHELCHFDRAIDYNNLALESIQESLGPDTSDLFEIASQTRVNLGENYLMTGDVKKARENLELVYESAKNPAYYLGRTRWYPRCLLGLGELWLQKGEMDKAEGFLSELFEHLWTHKFPYKKYQVRAWHLRSNILSEKRHMADAETELNRALGLAMQLGNPTLLWKIHQAAGKLLFKQGRSKEAKAEFQTAVKIVHGIAEGLADAALKEGYLQSDPIQKLFLQAKKR
jgi:class 3 adenylate cyclase/tetratricopeptide (TPR) repeat protein